MRDLSMHVLDITMNSIRANAKNIEIIVNEQIIADYLELIITDDGEGMSADEIKQVLSPFYTTRTTREVGLGLALLAQNVELTGGELSIDSLEGEGTTVYAKFVYSHIDRIPIGNLAETIVSLIIMEPAIDFLYRYTQENKIYVLDTKEIKRLIEEVPINHPKVIEWIKEDLKQSF
jgi:Histidine kinase-, DNA gyrase B-, and HSP90-like ATPase